MANFRKFFKNKGQCTLNWPNFSQSSWTTIYDPRVTVGDLTELANDDMIMSMAHLGVKLTLRFRPS